MGLEGRAGDWGQMDYNVSSDTSAPGPHSVHEWTPAWVNEIDYRPLGLPFAAGYRAPKGGGQLQPRRRPHAPAPDASSLPPTGAGSCLSGAGSSTVAAQVHIAAMKKNRYGAWGRLRMSSRRGGDAECEAGRSGRKGGRPSPWVIRAEDRADRDERRHGSSPGTRAVRARPPATAGRGTRCRGSGFRRPESSRVLP